MSDSKLHESTDLKDSHAERARTRAIDRQENSQPDDIGPDSRIENLANHPVIAIAQGEDLEGISTSRSTTEGTVDTTESLKDVSTQLDQSRARGFNAGSGAQQTGDQQGSGQNKDHADGGIAKEQQLSTGSDDRHGLQTSSGESLSELDVGLPGIAH